MTSCLVLALYCGLANGINATHTLAQVRLVLLCVWWLAACADLTFLKKLPESVVVTWVEGLCLPSGFLGEVRWIFICIGGLPLTHSNARLVHINIIAC